MDQAGIVNVNDFRDPGLRITLVSLFIVIVAKVPVYLCHPSWAL